MTPATRPADAAPFGVLASRLRTDEKRVLEALERRRMPYEFVDSRALWRDLADTTARWPVVLNREIGHTRALYAARALEAAGCTVLNSARAIELCGDKYLTSVALRDAGLPTPRTALALTPQAALDALEAIGYPAVIKPLTGSWGRLVAKLPDAESAATVLEYVAALPSPASHLVYAQELVDKPDRDIRVIVVGDEPVGAVYRRSSDWRTNVARGAETLRCEVTDDIAKLAVTAAQCVGADIAGVDLIEDAAGQLMVLEVNHGVEFSGFRRALGDDAPVADRIVDLLAARSASCSG
ncbi:Alpha-aminoadipate--LysW ligase LysX [Streptomyces sp. RB5]|uniref:Alpha-aminoadipate--LysW ligase LysX n=1 Tax=Streptomyces smaragdinus TaxID=2585196 RepID=A0A7K0CHD1_9ACTN|nr:lysine biosynthesis protein LysX [Streptomyces smaragdinus]MQY12868.1 Alpha-aminoadipate--LysW ligase LysX [Streptomyces smaragdinus]